MAAQHQYHRTNNRRQVIQKQKARLELGYWAFGARKGYKMKKDVIHGKILKPFYPEADYLKEALEGFAYGRFTHKVDACRLLVEKGFWKKQKAERYIDKFTNILTDPVYAGYIAYPMWEVAMRKGHHEGIISLETYETIQKRLNQENCNKRVRKDVSPDFPLRGLLVCRECGRHITGAWTQGRTKEYAYYFCQNKQCDTHTKACPKAEVEGGFNDLLESSFLRDEIGNVLEAVFAGAWKKELAHLKSFEVSSEREKKLKEEELKELIALIRRAKKQSVINVCEKKIEELSDEIEELSRVSIDELDLDVPYQTALDKSRSMLKSPYKVWHSVDVHEKQKLFHFIFDEKLAYSKKAGYRTDNLPCAIRVFEEFVTTNSPDVEMGVIETPSENGHKHESSMRSYTFRF